MAFGAVYAWQGLASFLTGGLVAALILMAAGLQDSAWAPAAGQYVGYVLGGALGGAGLAWGFPRRRASARAAAGFAVGFLAPAFAAAPARTTLLTLDFGERPPSGALVSTVLAFGGSLAAAGGIGLGFVAPRLLWAGAVRFLLAGVAGGLVAASGPAYVASRFEEPPTAAAMAAIALVLLGHLTAFALGGFLAGRRLEADAAREPQARG